MSLQSVSDLSNEIETIVDVDENLWVKRAHVGKFLGIVNIYRSMAKLTDEDQKTWALLQAEGGVQPYPWPGRKDQKNEWDIFLSRRGVLYVINKCRKPTPNLINLAKCLGTELHKNKWLSKEQDTLKKIMQAFNGEEMIHQFSVGKYRIDLFFPRYKLAIECDEFDHRDRDISYEAGRQKHIKRLLGCSFVRFNPDAKDFCILEVVNEIFVQIKSSFQM